MFFFLHPKCHHCCLPIFSSYCSVREVLVSFLFSFFFTHDFQEKQFRVLSIMSHRLLLLFTITMPRTDSPLEEHRQHPDRERERGGGDVPPPLELVSFSTSFPTTCFIVQAILFLASTAYFLQETARNVLTLPLCTLIRHLCFQAVFFPQRTTLEASFLLQVISCTTNKRNLVLD